MPEAPDLPIQYTEIAGNRIRYIKTGSGPTLVLLHTLRTQLDIFEKVVAAMSRIDQLRISIAQCRDRRAYCERRLTDFANSADQSDFYNTKVLCKEF